MTRSLARHSRRGGVAAGCLIALAVVVAALVAGGIYVAMNWKNWAAAGITAVTEEVVRESNLPQDQKDAILADVKTLAADFKAGKVSTAEMGRVAEEIAHSPLIPLGAVATAQKKYIEPSDMTPEEKGAAVRSLQRFARGVYEKKIPKEAIDDVVKPIVTLRPEGRWEFKAKPTRLELDQFVANVKAKADEAGVPDEAFELNIAEELKKAIDQALGRAGVS